MSSQEQPDKIILMGLGASGKSSITSIIFEGKSVDDVKGYHATIQYARTPVSLIKDLQILDCGGQDSFITAFLGEEKSEFIFSDLKALIWVLDISDSKNVSTSKYYFDTAINNIIKHSPRAIVFVFFHKMDLIKEDMRIQLFAGLSEFFKPPMEKDVNVQFFPTSIYDKSLYKCLGYIITHIVKSGSKTGSVSDEIKTFLEKEENFYNIAVYSNEGLAVFEEGKHTEELTVPANLMLSTFDQLYERLGPQKTMINIVELDNFFYYFKRIKKDYLLCGLANKNYNFELGFQIFQSIEELVMKLFD